LAIVSQKGRIPVQTRMLTTRRLDMYRIILFTVEEYLWRKGVGSET